MRSCFRLLPPLIMKSFFSHRRTRFTAAVMLFIWLLALGTGIANACLVHEDHARHGHLSRQDAGDHDTSPAKKACQNFCAAEQTGVVKQKTDAPASLDVAPVLVSMWWVAPLSADRPFSLPAFDDPPLAQPPVFIRFLRLTI